MEMSSVDMETHRPCSVQFPAVNLDIDNYIFLQDIQNPFEVYKIQIFQLKQDNGTCDN